MPHQCTGCHRTFADGSKQMLSGCPDCGGNKFQYKPSTNGDRSASSAAGGSSSRTQRTESDSDAPAGSPPGTESPDAMGSNGGTITTIRDWIQRSGAQTNARTGDTSPDDPDSDDSDDLPGLDDPAEEGSEPSEETASPEPPTERTSDTDGNRVSEDAEIEHETGVEDRAQASARSGMIGPDELPGESFATTDLGRTGTVDSPADKRQTDSSRHDRPTESPTLGADKPAERDDPSRREITQKSTDRRSSSSDSATNPERHDERDDTYQPDLAELREELNDQFESIKIIEPGQYELNLMELYEREEYIIELQENGRYVIEVPDHLLDD